MARIPGARKEDLPDDIQHMWETQERSEGVVRPNLPVYSLRPAIYRGHRALATGIEESGLIPAELKHLVALRAALINGCPF